MNFDDDTDLSRAIALSLQESGKPIVHSIDDDDDDEELRRVLEASKAEAENAQVPSSSSQSPATSPPPLPTTAAPSTDRVIHSATTKSFLSERAQMERERLKRARKAKGLPEESDEDTKGKSNGVYEDSDDEDEAKMLEPPNKRQRVSSSGNHHTQTNTPYSSNATPGSSKGGELFWNGELRPTATAGVEPRKDGKRTFRLSEILGDVGVAFVSTGLSMLKDHQKTDMSFAIISTFALDLPWIYQLFERGIPVILVGQPEQDGKAGMHNVLPDWIKTVPFLKGGYGCMHMKFMLIFYKTGRLRVAVTTANLNPFDWRDIENAAWVQDIPPLRSPSAFDKKATTQFQYVMKRVLDNVNVRPALATMLKQGHPNLPIKSTEDICTRWDWSKVRVHLVPSIAGRHEGWPNVILNGHTRLMKAVLELGLRTGKGMSAKTLQVEYQGSSIGGYSTQWLNEWFWSARGESPQDWLDEPRRKREKLPYPSGLQILFPSKETVHSSQYGERGGGTNFCTRKQWEGTNFPRHLFHDSRSRAGPTLMHTKTIVATFVDKPSTSKGGASKLTTTRNSKNQEVVEISDDSTTEPESDDEIQIIETAVGWAYVGSHNFTPSAWGTLSGSAFNPVMNVRPLCSLFLAKLMAL
ncbi:hypothetical protein AAF712_014616 [Marasmius tenuissimus]|uniref:Phospholipase D/nuclease n=1 Tax=Marasmius tenuissimus TaxID=585030 RepID=A0ABR2ZBJ4_9AGAR